VIKKLPRTILHSGLFRAVWLLALLSVQACSLYAGLPSLSVGLPDGTSLTAVPQRPPAQYSDAASLAQLRQAAVLGPDGSPAWSVELPVSAYVWRLAEPFSVGQEQVLRIQLPAASAIGSSAADNGSNASDTEPPSSSANIFLVGLLDAEGSLLGALLLPELPARYASAELELEIPLPAGVLVDRVLLVAHESLKTENSAWGQLLRLSFAARLSALELEADNGSIPSGVQLAIHDDLVSISKLQSQPVFSGSTILQLEYEMPVLPFDPAWSQQLQLVELDLMLATADGKSRSGQLRLRPGRNSVYIHSMLFGIAIDTLQLSSLPEGFQLRALRPISNTVVGTEGSTGSLAPALPADAWTILNYPQQAWRQPHYELFAWSLFPNVLIFDFADYNVQSRFFKRLAFYTEKTGFIGQLLSDQELVGRHGYNAHNYSAAGLANFFNAADSAAFALLPEEELLRQIALQAGLLTGQPGAYQPGQGGVLSISRQSARVASSLRGLLLTHEAMHGVFYEAAEFSSSVFDYWNLTLSAQQKDFWRMFMEYLNYSSTDEYLMVNELQAYLLQYRLAENDWYWNTLIRQRLEAAYPERKKEISDFYIRNPLFFMQTSATFNAKLLKTTGLIGGDVFCLLFPD